MQYEPTSYFFLGAFFISALSIASLSRRAR
jgi:hypothetical protein